MKRVLSLLLAFVFLQVETWALSGGPQYGGNQAAVSGTYAGVFTGLSGAQVALPGIIPTDPAVAEAIASNALGIFVVGVPVTDVAQGTVALFFQGTFFQGGIIGIADPNKQTLVGVCQAVHIQTIQTYNDIFFGINQTSITYDARADGTIKTKIGGGGTFGTTLEGTGTFTASVIVDQPVTIPDPDNPGEFITTILQTSVPTGNLDFKVDGYKQSTTVVIPNADSTAALLNGSGTGVGG